MCSQVQLLIDVYSGMHACVYSSIDPSTLWPMYASCIPMSNVYPGDTVNSMHALLCITFMCGYCVYQLLYRRLIINKSTKL